MKTYREGPDGALSLDGGPSMITQGHPLYAVAQKEVEEGEAEIIAYDPTPTAEEKVAAYRAAVGRHIDQQAQTFGFDSIVTAVTYADEPADPLSQSYGVALRAWRSKCWEKCREVQTAWQGGGAEPTVEELLASLPVFEGP